MKDQQISPQESLELINSMFSKTRQCFMRHSFFFLIWGVLCVLASLSELIMIGMESKFNWLPWPVFMTIGGIVASIYGAKEGKKAGVSTFADKIMNSIWGAYVITLICIIIGTVINRGNPGPYILLITGLATFLSGKIANFKPLMYGSILFWAGGIFALLSCSPAFSFTIAPYESLIYTFCYLFGYLVPGYMLMKIERTNV